MSAISGISLDPMPEPLGDGPTPSGTDDADAAGFGLALAIAAAAQSQIAMTPPQPAAPTPVVLPEGDAGTHADPGLPASIDEDAAPTGTFAPSTGTFAPPARPLPARPPFAGDTTSDLASGSSAAWPAGPAGGATAFGAPVRTTPARGPAAPQPVLPAGDADGDEPVTPATVYRTAQALAAPMSVPATTVDSAPSRGVPFDPSRPVTDGPAAAPTQPGPTGTAAVAPPQDALSQDAPTATPSAPTTTSDLSLTVRVLEVVRDLTEQAARIALDTAAAAGPLTDAPWSAGATVSGRGRHDPGMDPAASRGDLSLTGGDTFRRARATTAIEALQGATVSARGRLAEAAPARPAFDVLPATRSAEPAPVTPLPGSTPQDAAAPAVTPRPLVTAPPLPPGGTPGRDAGTSGGGRDAATSGEGGDDGNDATRSWSAARSATSAPRPQLATDTAPAAAWTAPQAGSAASVGATDEPRAETPRSVDVPQPTPRAAYTGDRITLQFSGEDGLEGKLNVAVRGQNVRATIVTDDPAAAQRFTRGLDGLHRTLADQGFTGAQLSVQQTTRAGNAASTDLPREGGHGNPQPRGEGRERQPSSRQEREASTSDDRPNRRSSRSRTER